MGARGRTAAHKELSAPADPSDAVMRGLDALAQGEGLSLERLLARVDGIVHGTTVTTNAVLTGRTARTDLVTTRGLWLLPLSGSTDDRTAHGSSRTLHNARCALGPSDSYRQIRRTRPRQGI